MRGHFRYNKSYPLTGISSRDSKGWLAKGIRIGLPQLIFSVWWLYCILHILIFLFRVTLSNVSRNFHRMLGVGQISCTSNPSNGAYSSGTLKHFFNLDLHNSSALSERFSKSPVLSVGRGVTSLPPYRNRRPHRWILEYHILFALSFFSTSKTGETQGMIR